MLRIFPHWIPVLVAMLIPLSGFAMPQLKRIDVKNGSAVDLIFNERVERSQIEVSYFNDIIQLSIQNSSIYPAKIIPVNQSDILKVFAYQYSPKLTRCRLTVNGKAEEFKSRFHLSYRGKSVSLKLDPSLNSPGDTPTQGNSRTQESSSTQGNHEEEIDEKVLLEKVMSSQRAQGSPHSKEGAQGKNAGGEYSNERERPILTGNHPLPSFMSVIVKLGSVLLIFVAFAVFLNKVKMAESKKAKGLMKAISKFTHQAMNKDGKMIQVVSTHRIDPKKSITVVRVARQVLVLGVCNESISLITQLQSDSDENTGSVNSSDYADFLTPEKENRFSSLFESEKQKPIPQIAQFNPFEENTRSRIRHRLEGLKPL